MIKFNINKLLIVLISIFIINASMALSFASVTMMGTRIIYDSDSKSVDVNLKNQSDFPYVVQTWLDDGDESVTANDKSNAPFFATPSISKIQPNTTQIIRIAYTGNKTLPQDRESVFYFNFLQIPPSNVGDNFSSNKNKMLIMLKNRVKLFYRPAGINGRPDELLKQLTIKRISKGNQLTVELYNPSPFYASLSEVAFSNNNKTYQTQPNMIPPFSSKNFTFKGVSTATKGNVKVTFINDQGARLSESYRLD